MKLRKPRSNTCSLHHETLVKEIGISWDPIFTGIVDRYGHQEYEAEAVRRFPNSSLGCILACCSRRGGLGVHCRICQREELSWLRAYIEDIPEQEVVLNAAEWCKCPGCGLRFLAKTRGSWRPAIQCGSCGRYEYLWLESREIDGTTSFGVIDRCAGCGTSYQMKGLPPDGKIGAHLTCGQRIRLRRVASK